MSTLQSRFGIPGAVAIGKGSGGHPRVALAHPSGSSAEVYLHGAHITSWKTPRDGELLFLSDNAVVAEHHPIRGGIPVVFPQFGDGALPKHGFARLLRWSILRTERTSGGDVAVILELSETQQSLVYWPYRFRAELSVHLAETLSIALGITNTGPVPLDFQAAFHTYFRVSDIGSAAVSGLQGITYLDSLQNDAVAIESRDEIRFAEEVDRIYADVPPSLVIRDDGASRRLAIKSESMRDAVVWNPWIAKSKSLPDFGAEEYRRMVCVETGTIIDSILLEPGQSWKGRTTFRPLAG